MALYALTKELGGSEDLITADEPTMQDIGAAAKEARVDDLGLQHTPSWHCGRCQTYCPAGHWGEKFRKTGLSKK
jgi:hypothetical protein